MKLILSLTLLFLIVAYWGPALGAPVEKSNNLESRLQRSFQGARGFGKRNIFTGARGFGKRFQGARGFGKRGDEEQSPYDQTSLSEGEEEMHMPPAVTVLYELQPVEEEENQKASFQPFR